MEEVKKEEDDQAAKTVSGFFSRMTKTKPDQDDAQGDDDTDGKGKEEAPKRSTFFSRITAKAKTEANEDGDDKKDDEQTTGDQPLSFFSRMRGIAAARSTKNAQ